MQVPIANERDDLAVRNVARLMHLLIGGQEPPSVLLMAVRDVWAQYAAWRTKASRPKRTVSVSVVAPQAAFASLKSLSSAFKIFFMHTTIP